MYFTTIFLVSKSPLLPMLPSIYPTNTNRNPVLSSLLSLTTAIPLHDPVLFLLKNNCPFPVYIREAVASRPPPLGALQELGRDPRGQNARAQHGVWRDAGVKG